MNGHPTSRRFIYLDYDSVLHHDSVYIHPTKGIYMRERGFTLFEWMPILEELLKAHPNVGIILSTSWVRVKSFSYAKSRLSSELKKRVIGATFHKGQMSKELFSQLTRASQILGDVSRRGFGDGDWIAIDDDVEGWPFMYAKNLIRTGWAGISDTEVQADINRWLNKGNKT